MTDRVEDLGFARLDLSRADRTGASETVFCPGKTCEQLVSIVSAFIKNKTPFLGTKCSGEQADFLKRASLEIEYDAVSRILLWGKNAHISGRIAVCTGGTADIPVAEEAAKTAEFLGADVDRFYDIGVAGLHRLLSRIEEIRKADIVIAVAGMEGALGSVLAGLVKAPVIAVPTSVGYGASFHGVAPLLSMLNSCAEGMSVVNIDNGFGAAMQAYRILKIERTSH